MKYPQLVSTRAVNAISDWLVSRLEQLGVEAPLIYSRLLLSLLQSSVQINDPIEFSNLETFLANRKGHNKRYPSCDKDALKKITAVQCLTEIVSSEQEITKIESLVDELCEKLNDVEQQSMNFDDSDQQLLHATISVRSNSKGDSKIVNNNKNSHHHRHHIRIDVVESRLNSNSSSSTSSLSGASSATTTADIEDPRKRYYKAFPALSKDMDDSMRVFKKDEKSLTWPLDKKISNTSLLANNIGRASFKAITVPQSSALKNRVNCVTESISCGKSTAKVEESIARTLPEAVNNQSQNTNTDVKRKTKRRRNQALSKCKFSNTTRKYLNSGKIKSPICWDTDFEGSWEMGRDLIKEFIVKENNRNRSTSESAAYGMMSSQSQNRHLHEGHGCNDCDEEYFEKRMKPMDIGDKFFKQQLIQNYSNDSDHFQATAIEDCVVDIPFCEEKIFPSPEAGIEGTATVSKLSDDSLNVTRRLYERDGPNGSLNHINSDDQHDFALLEAKFDSNIEALWKNASNDEEDHVVSLPSSFPELPSPAVAVFRENLKNFWSHYYTKLTEERSLKQDNSAGMLIGESSSSDYYSMSSNIDNFEKSVGASVKGPNGNTTPIGVFLQNTIWSENKTSSYSDTDETFSFKVWNSLNNNSVKADDSVSHSNESQYYIPYNNSKWSEGINGGPNIPTCFDKQNEIPFLCQHEPSSVVIAPSSLMNHSTRSDFTPKESRSSSVISSSGFIGNINWQTPAGQNLEVDMKSWNVSNPMSLPEMYGSKSMTSGTQRHLILSNVHTCNADDSYTSIPGSKPSSLLSSPDSSCSSISTNITLANHSVTSGFVEYAHIKSLVKFSEPIGNHRNSNAVSSNTSPSTTSSYPDDENLLTSERTHFHPIKSYADGHSFDISSSLDVIEYDRSQSGYLYFDSEKYLEYTRSDVFLSEEENVLSSNAGLYSLSNYVFSNLPPTANTLSSSNVSKTMSNFIVKFRVRNNEVACQTDLPLSVISTRDIPSNNRNITANTSCCNIKNETKTDLIHNFVALAKISSQKDEVKRINNAGSKYRAIQTEYSMSLDWTMIEIGKRCVDNNNSSHTLWGMCHACNNDMKSIPADRLLKDELKVEADEIMSDLKYMQDLYIGSDWDDCEEHDGDDSDDGVDDFDDDVIRCEDNDIDLDQSTSSVNCNEAAKSNEVDQQHQDILYSVNKLIADLLRPSQNNCAVFSTTDETRVKAKTCFGQSIHNNSTLKISSDVVDNNVIVEDQEKIDEKYIGGLWTCDENLIWKKEYTPINVIAHLQNSNNNIENCFVDQLNWKYANLAKIWDNVSPLKPHDSYFNQTINNENANKSNKQSPDDHWQKKYVEKAITTRNSFMKMEPIFPMLEKQQNPKRQPFNDFYQSVHNIYASMPFKISNRFDRKRRHSASQSIVSYFLNNNNYNYGNNNNDDNNNDNNNDDKNIDNIKNYYNNKNNFNNNRNDSNKNNNNNITQNNNISNKNIRNLKFNTMQDDVPIALTYESFTSTREQKVSDNLNNSCNAENIFDQYDVESMLDPHKTIITCKYWTTVKPLSPTEYESHVDSRASTSLFTEKGVMSSIALDTSSILKHVTLTSRPLTR